MNHRERILSAIRHEPVDRLPTDIWATQEVWQKLSAHFQVDNRLDLYDCLNIDGIIGVPPPYIGPEHHPQVFEQFYRVPMQRAIDLAKSFDLAVFHHDDGDLRALLPTLTDMGIDILNPIQWRCGDWDLSALKAEYGARLCFHGGVDNQQTLPFGTPDDVQTEVKQLIATLGSDRTGFIIAPCHNLQANTAVENIVAMYQTAYEHGVLPS